MVQVKIKYTYSTPDEMHSCTIQVLDSFRVRTFVGEGLTKQEAYDGALSYWQDSMTEEAIAKFEAEPYRLVREWQDRQSKP